MYELWVFKMLILIGCEESQVLCKEFRKVGHEAFSCDILDTRGNPDWHYKEDIKKVIPKHQWDLIILHPDCTALAVSGNRWYAGSDEREEAIQWTVDLWNLACKYSPRVALENPVSVIWKYLPNHFYIQPWQFGHGETKKTGFCIKGLKKLKPTNIVEGRSNRIHMMPEHKNRKRDRSETYQGIAEAIVQQWGGNNVKTRGSNENDLY